MYTQINSCNVKSSKPVFHSLPNCVFITHDEETKEMKTQESFNRFIDNILDSLGYVKLLHTNIEVGDFVHNYEVVKNVEFTFYRVSELKVDNEIIVPDHGFWYLTTKG